MSEHDIFSWSPNKELGQLIEKQIHILEEKAKQLLSEGNVEGLKLFKEAADLLPSSKMLLLKQAKTIFDFGLVHHNVSFLKEALFKLEIAIEIDPLLIEAWHLSAIIFDTLSQTNRSHHDQLQAKTRITLAIQLLSHDTEMKDPKLYWDAGRIFYHLFESSLEPSDLTQSIEYFEKAARPEMPPEFWNHLGKAYTVLSERLNDVRPIFKAIQNYKIALSKALPNIKGWTGLGQNLKNLFHFTHDLDHFQQSYDCLSAALQINPKDFGLWKEKITLLLQVARLKKDISKAQLALEQCAVAAAIFVLPPIANLKLTFDQMQPVEGAEAPPSIEPIFSDQQLSQLGLIFSFWAEAFALLGEFEDEAKWITESEKKMEQAASFTLEPSLEFLLQEGKTLFSQASYHEDVDMYYEAISRFQEAVSLDRTLAEGWTWMGASYAALFALTTDSYDLAKAIRFYQKSLHLKSSPSLHFEIAVLLTLQGELTQDTALLEQAVEYFEHLFHSYPALGYHHPEWFFSYATALSMLGHIKEQVVLQKKALEALICVLMFDPHYPGVHHRLGLIYCHIGNETDNVDDFYRSLQHLKLAAQEEQDCDSIYTDWAVTLMSLSEYATDPLMEEHMLCEAEKKLIEAAQLGNQQSYYHLACLYSLKKMLDLSLHYLHKGLEAKTLPSFEELQEDEWLDTVRLYPGFQEFLALLQKN